MSVWERPLQQHTIIASQPSRLLPAGCSAVGLATVSILNRRGVSQAMESKDTSMDISLPLGLSLPSLAVNSLAGEGCKLPGSGCDRTVQSWPVPVQHK